MIGVILPVLREYQRRTADFCAWGCEPLVESRPSVSVTDVGRDSLQGSFSTHHTPSPQGPCSTAHSARPRFFGLQQRGVVSRTPATRMEPWERFCVGLQAKSRQGNALCRSKTSHSPFSAAAGLPPVVIRWATRRWAVQPLARVPQHSPTAAWRRVLPLGLRATLPTVSSTPADVTNTQFTARSPLRRSSIPNPAQPALWRGFSHSLKTQKDLTCSKRS